MAWEQRGGRRYYYRAQRVGRRVVKEYVGAGRAAEVSAQLDADLRVLEGQERAAGEEVDEELECDEGALDQLEAITAAALAAAGFHRPKRGRWRRRRG